MLQRQLRRQEPGDSEGKDGTAENICDRTEIPFGRKTGRNRDADHWRFVALKRT